MQHGAEQHVLLHDVRPEDESSPTQTGMKVSVTVEISGTVTTTVKLRIRPLSVLKALTHTDDSCAVLVTTPVNTRRVSILHTPLKRAQVPDEHNCPPYFRTLELIPQCSTLRSPGRNPSLHLFRFRDAVLIRHHQIKHHAPDGEQRLRVGQT